jgi:hypothetical protein
MIQSEKFVLAILTIATATLALSLLAYAATKPDTFRIERVTYVEAPPEKIFALLDDFRRWISWSPHDQADPTMTRTYSGAASGKGALSAWESRGSGGKGRMEITDSAPPARSQSPWTG